MVNKKYAWIQNPDFIDSLAKARADAERFGDSIKQAVENAKRQHQQTMQQCLNQIATKQREKHEIDDLNTSYRRCGRCRSPGECSQSRPQDRRER